MTWGRRPSAALMLSGLLALVACTPSPAPLATLPPLAPVTSTPATVAPPTPVPSTSSTSPTAPSPVTTPSTLETITATAIPTSAPSGDNSEAAAISTAEAFLGATILASVQRNAAPVRRLALPTCEFLRTLDSAIKYLRDHNQRVESDAFSPVELAVTKHDGDQLTAHVKYTVPGYRAFDANRKVIERSPPLPLTVDIFMQYVDGSWKVAHYFKAAS